MKVIGARFLLAASLGLTAFPSLGCATKNRLNQEIRLEHAAATSDGVPAWWAAVPPVDAGAPLVIFVEGDGGNCQSFSEGLWTRFVTRFAGRFVLVRPHWRVNSLCEDRERWALLDFRHRIAELETVVPALRRAFPGRPVIVLGHSAGAHVARAYAEAHPDDVAGLINLSGGYDDLSGVLRDIAEEDPARAPAIEGFVLEVRGMPPQAPIWDRTALFWQEMLGSGVRTLWSSYRKPCLALHGMKDDTSVPYRGVRKDADEVEAAGGSCRLVVLEDAGHDTLDEATFQLIDGWLEAGWPSTPARGTQH